MLVLIHCRQGKKQCGILFPVGFIKAYRLFKLYKRNGRAAHAGRPFCRMRNCQAGHNDNIGPKLLHTFNDAPGILGRGTACAHQRQAAFLYGILPIFRFFKKGIPLFLYNFFQQQLAHLFSILSFSALNYNSFCI